MKPINDEADIYDTANCYTVKEDPRAINVVENIKNAKSVPTINDDIVTKHDLDCMLALANGAGTIIMPVEEFKEALLAGGTVTLTGDVTLEEQLLLTEGTSTVLNLNGKTLNLNYSDNYAINTKGNLVIEGEGTVNVSGYGLATSTSGTGSIIINGGTFVASGCDYLIGCFGNDIIINGGTFNGEYCVVNNFAKYYGKEGVVTINGGNFFHDKSKDGMTVVCLDKEGNVYSEGIIINGGTFDDDISDYLAEGKSVIFEEDRIVVV